MSKIRSIIVDDERPAREELKLALLSFPSVELLGEAENADDAKKMIETEKPDLIFLDIEMPEKSGFDLLNELAHQPKIIFVTAFDEYAVRAFEADALDYLLKPIREERFAKAMEKLQHAWDTDTRARDERKIFLRDGEHLHIFSVNEISLIESVENYTRVLFNEKKALIRRSLKQWEEFLDLRKFIRANRTELINISFIEHINTSKAGRLMVTMRSGREVEVSSRQSRRFRNMNNI